MIFSGGHRDGNGGESTLRTEGCGGRRRREGAALTILTGAAALLTVIAAGPTGARAQAAKSPDQVCADQMARYGVQLKGNADIHRQKAHRSVYADGVTSDGQPVRMRCSMSGGGVASIQVYAPPAFGSSQPGPQWTDANKVLGEPQDVTQQKKTQTKVASTPPANGQGTKPEDVKPGGKTPLPGGKAPLPGGNAQLPGSTGTAPGVTAPQGGTGALPDGKSSPQGGATGQLPDGKSVPQGQTAQLPDGKTAPSGGTLLPQGDGTKTVPTAPAQPTAPQPGLFKRAPSSG